MKKRSERIALMSFNFLVTQRQPVAAQFCQLAVGKGKHRLEITIFETKCVGNCRSVCTKTKASVSRLVPRLLAQSAATLSPGPAAALYNFGGFVGPNCFVTDLM